MTDHKKFEKTNYQFTMDHGIWTLGTCLAEELEGKLTHLGSMYRTIFGPIPQDHLGLSRGGAFCMGFGQIYTSGFLFLRVDRG